MIVTDAMVELPRADVEFVVQIANRNEKSEAGDRLAVLLSRLRDALSAGDAPAPEAVFRPCISISEEAGITEAVFEDVAYVAEPVFPGVHHWIDKHLALDDGRLVGMAIWATKPPAPAPEAAAVKALKWCDNVANTTIGSYTFVGDDEDGATWTYHEYPYGDASEMLPSVEAAKAAAQADYERRIRSAIAPTEEDRALANFDTFAAEHFASSRAALASEAVAWADAWADPRAIEALQNKTAAGSVYLARERSDAYTCPLYTHPTPAPVGQLVERIDDLITETYRFEENGYYDTPLTFLLRDLRAAIAGGAAGDGWRLVPVEPTEAMLEAARHYNYGYVGGEHKWSGLYKAMLSASPAGRE
jgi:hypothetical protein